MRRQRLRLAVGLAAHLLMVGCAHELPRPDDATAAVLFKPPAIRVDCDKTGNIATAQRIGGMTQQFDGSSTFVTLRAFGDGSRCRLYVWTVPPREAAKYKGTTRFPDMAASNNAIQLLESAEMGPAPCVCRRYESLPLHAVPTS